MGKWVLFLCVVSSVSAFADPVMISTGDLYQGDLFINEQPAHRSCTISIEYRSDLPTLGSNCTKAKISYHFGVFIEGYIQNSVTLFSSVTNDQLPEYPAQKTCAVNRNGAPLSASIYSVKDEDIYNRMLSGVSKSGWISFDYFLKFSPETRLPISGALHRLAPLREDLYECEKLTKIN